MAAATTPSGSSRFPSRRCPARACWRRDAATRRALLEHAIARVRDGGYSSLHVLFPTPPEAAEGEAMGMIPRAGLQFHWTNPGYRDFADFLATFSHDKRKKVKQERRKRRRGRRHVRAHARPRHHGRPTGISSTAATNRRIASITRRPTSACEFFERIGAALPDNIAAGRSVRATDAGSARRSASTTARRCGDATGAPREFVSGLHFEACYYQSIEFCIEQRLARFEGGAQGVHKLARGLLPVATHSLHAIGDPRLRGGHRRLLRARTRRHRAFRRRTGGELAVQGNGPDV